MAFAFPSSGGSFNQYNTKNELYDLILAPIINQLSNEVMNKLNLYNYEKSIINLVPIKPPTLTNHHQELQTQEPNHQEPEINNNQTQSDYLTLLEHTVLKNHFEHCCKMKKQCQTGCCADGQKCKNKTGCCDHETLNNNKEIENVESEQTKSTKMFKCKTLNCNKQYAYEKALMKHESSCNFKSNEQKMNLKAAKQHKCPICFKEFGKIHHMKRHIDQVHSAERPFKCDKCNARFKDKYNLKVHQRIHTGEKPYNCIICNKRFNQKSALTSHLKIHNDRAITEKKIQFNNAITDFLKHDKIQETFIDEIKNLDKNEILKINRSKNDSGEFSADYSNDDQSAILSEAQKQIAIRSAELKEAYNKISRTRSTSISSSVTNSEITLVGHIKIYTCDYEKCDYETESLNKLKVHKTEVHSNLDNLLLKENPESCCGPLTCTMDCNTIQVNVKANEIFM